MRAAAADRTSIQRPRSQTTCPLSNLGSFVRAFLSRCSPLHPQYVAASTLQVGLDRKVESSIRVCRDTLHVCQLAREGGESLEPILNSVAVKLTLCAVSDIKSVLCPVDRLREEVVAVTDWAVEAPILPHHVKDLVAIVGDEEMA